MSGNKNVPTKETPGADMFSGKLFQTFKEEITPTSAKLYENKKEGILPILQCQYNLDNKI